MPAIILSKTNMGRTMHTIKAVWMWVKELFGGVHRQEIDQYLAESADQYDLEYRIRALSSKGLI